MATRDELYNVLQKFIDGRHTLSVPVREDDDDHVMARAIDELEKLREENNLLRSESKDLKFILKQAGVSWKRCVRD